MTNSNINSNFYTVLDKKTQNKTKKQKQKQNRYWKTETFFIIVAYFNETLMA